MSFGASAPHRLVQLSCSASDGGGSGGQPGAGQRPGLEQVTEQWRTRCISNLDYLLHLNRAVGRRPGDRTFSPQLPWVLDMTCAPEDIANTTGVGLSHLGTEVSPPFGTSFCACICLRARGDAERADHRKRGAAGVGL